MRRIWLGGRRRCQRQKKRSKENGRALGLMRGANVVMPNLTPPAYRVMYEIYPDKACINETADMCRGCLQGRIESIGRHIGTGPGGRRS